MPRTPKTTQRVIDLTLDNVEDTDIVGVNRQEFLDYAIAVATDRAIPRFDDGLKPVQRRILFAMHQMKLAPTSKHRKAQQVEGDVMGKYHPHAGSYSSMVYLTEPFTFHLPMIDGRGSFHDISGNASAAARYTEVRLSEYGQSFVDRLSKDLVPYEANYDQTLELPKVFPVQLPMLLINGVKTGIAVGFTSAIAPHNPVDATRLLREYLKNPKIRLATALGILGGPDLPTGGVLIGDLDEYYATGVGRFQNEGVIIDSPDNPNGLVITQVPYNMAGAVGGYVEKVKDMIFNNRLRGIKEIDDFTGPDDIAANRVRLEVTLQPGFDHEQAKLMLLTKTDLRQTYSLQWMALDGKTPKVFNLMGYLESFAVFQHTLIVREFKAIRRKAVARLEIVGALITVPANLDALIHAAQNTDGKADLVEVLRGSKRVDGQKVEFSYTEAQADALAMMRVYQLNRIDAAKMIEERRDLEQTIADADIKITDPDERVRVLTDRLGAAIKDLTKAGYGERKTTLLGADTLRSFKEQVIITDVTVTRDKYGYIKYTDRRTVSDDDVIEVLDTTDDNLLLLFTDAGNQYQVPFTRLRKHSARSTDRGDNLVSVFAENGLTASESVLLMTTRKHIEAEGTQMFTVSSLGLAKRFVTATSKLVTKTLRRQVDFYASKFESDPLVHVSIHAPEAFEQRDVVVVKGRLFKRLPFDAVKFQGSASGAGAQTFYEKDGDRVDAVYVIDKDARGEYLTREHVRFNIEDLPVLKEAQRFQDVTDPVGGTVKRGTTPQPCDRNDAAVRMLDDGTLEFFWGESEVEGGVFTGTYSEVITRELVLVYASGAAKIMPGDSLAVATRRAKIQGTKVPETDPLTYVAYVESPYISTTYTDGAVKTIAMDTISRQGKAGTGANTFNHTAKIEKIAQLADLGDIPLLTKAQKPR